MEMQQRMGAGVTLLDMRARWGWARWRARQGGCSEAKMARTLRGAARSRGVRRRTGLGEVKQQSAVRGEEEAADGSGYSAAAVPWASS